MLVKIDGADTSTMPTERVVTISTLAGKEEVVVHESQIIDGKLEVGYIGKKNDSVLVELPRESVSGRWRIWVLNALTA